MKKYFKEYVSAISMLTILTLIPLFSNAQIGVNTDDAIQIGNTTTNSDGTIRFTGTDFEGYFNAMWHSLTNGGGAGVWNTSGSDIYFDSGDVGIGVMMPDEQLHVGGTTKIELNSTTGTPHLLLVEDDASISGSTRIEFNHSDNPTDRFELRSFVTSSPFEDQRIGWYYNGADRVVYNESEGGLGIGTELPSAMLDVVGDGEFTYDSDGSDPTLELWETEDDDFARLFFRNSASPSDRWAISARTGTTNDHVLGWYYNGSPRVIYNEDLDGFGIGTSSPSEKLEVAFSGANGIRIEGDNTGDARLWIENGGGSHFLFDDTSDGNNLKLQFSNDFSIDAGVGNSKFSIDGATGDASITNELSVGQLLTANQDIELRGADPRIDFWNPSPAGVGCSILYDENSSSGGNAGDLEIINYQLVGEIEFYTSTSNLNLRMNDTNIYSYEDFSPWLHKTNDLGLNGKAWDNVYADDYINQGSSSFNDRVVTEEIVNYPPIDKQPGDFDYMTERNDVEVNPNTLPPSLHENNGILIDEMTTYNYKANYEQQLQINELKELVKQLQKEIEDLKSKN